MTAALHSRSISSVDSWKWFFWSFVSSVIHLLVWHHLCSDLMARLSCACLFKFVSCFFLHCSCSYLRGIFKEALLDLTLFLFLKHALQLSAALLVCLLAVKWERITNRLGSEHVSHYMHPSKNSFLTDSLEKTIWFHIMLHQFSCINSLPSRKWG